MSELNGKGIAFSGKGIAFYMRIVIDPLLAVVFLRYLADDHRQDVRAVCEQ